MTARIIVLSAPNEPALWCAYQDAFARWEREPTGENEAAVARAFAAWQFAFLGRVA